MASKIQIRREMQRLKLIEAAELRMSQSGLAGLKARELAADVGIALGAIYNLVADLDELILRVASRTLSRLAVALREAEYTVKNEQPQERLLAIALAYRRFASQNNHLWQSLFDHRMSSGADVPEWAVADQKILLAYITRPLAQIMAGSDAVATEAMTITIFTAVHGIVSFGLEMRLVSQSEAELDDQLTQFMNAICTGLQQDKRL